MKMGVIRLESFVEQKCSPDAFYSVDMKMLAEQHRKSFKNKSKVNMIIDLQSCVRNVYEGLDLICGGQFKAYAERWHIFLKELSDSGICPIFISDGPPPPSKRQTWVKRRYATAEEFVFPVLDALKLNKDPNASAKRSIALPGLESEIMLSTVLDEELETIHSTPLQDADQLAVETAIKRNAFAIFAQDTDYLIYQYPTHIHYLSARHFKWKELFEGSRDLQTKTYDRLILSACLGLTLMQFPLFASLKGNDVVAFKDLQRFHQWLLEQRRPDRTSLHVDHHLVIEALAQFIIQEHLPGGEDIHNQIDRLTHFVFYGDMRFKHCLESSVKGYFQTSNSDHVIDPVCGNCTMVQ